MVDLGSTQRQVGLGSGPEQQQADRLIGLEQLATCSTGHRRGHGAAGHGTRIRPVMFDLGSTQRQVVLGSGQEQLQADRAIGHAQLATSRQRVGEAMAKRGTVLSGRLGIDSTGSCSRFRTGTGAS